MNKSTRVVQTFLLSALMCIGGSAYAAMSEESGSVSFAELQRQPVSGTVVDVSGTPVIGATVVIKGTNIGSTTGVNGEFSLNAEPGEELEVMYLGYKTLYVPVVAGQSTYNLTLEEDALEVGEVVVTALGIKREQKALGYAMTEVKGEDIAAANTVNPVSALQGRAAGVSISGSSGGVAGGTRINIRGAATLSGSNQPIFVVDGVILENQTSALITGDVDNTEDFGNILKNLNADDFATMSVLKGAAATALYGSRGINGAVVITTKSGQGRGFGVSVSQTTGIDWVYRGPDFQNEFGNGSMGGTSAINTPEGTNLRYQRNAFRYETDPNNPNDPKLYPTLRVSRGGEQYGPRFDGRPIIGYDGNWTTYEAQPNNYKQAYDLGVTSNINLTIQGGNEKMNFYLSDSYNYRKGTFPGNKFNRNSLLFKSTYNISDAVSVDASISFNMSTAKNPPRDFGRQFWYGSWGREYDTDKWKERQYWTTDHGGAPSSSWGDANATIPGASIWFGTHNRENVQKETMITPIVKLTIKPLDWMTLTGEVNMNYVSQKNEYKALGTGYENFGTTNGAGGQYRIGLTERISRTAKATMNLNKTWGDFTGNLILGGEWYHTERTVMNQSTEGGLIVPGQYFIANSQQIPTVSAYIDNTKNIYSAYFLASLSWREQVFLDITGRNDWSTALVYQDGTGKDSYFYPSVSASWIFSQTFNLPSWFSFGKLRASWAQVGNDTNPYRINTAYDVEGIQMASGLFYINTFGDRELISPDLKPERKNSFEVGLDVRFLKNRIGLDFTYYKENTKDQIISIPAPTESGVNTQLVNGGNIQNQGFEIALNTTPIKKQNFQWDLNFTWTRNRNKVIELHPDVGDYILLNGEITQGTRVGAVAYVGGEYGVILSDATTKKFYNEADPNDPRNGMDLLLWTQSSYAANLIRSGNIEKVGTIQPKFEGSMYNSFKIKNFDVNFLIDMRWGGYIASSSSRYGTSSGLLRRSLMGRDLEEGGIQFESKYANRAGTVYTDGFLPDGVFQQGSISTLPDGSQVDVSGMTFKDAYAKGYVEPVHMSSFQYHKNSWARGVINDDWIAEIKYIALRNLSIGYTFPQAMIKKIKLTNLRLSIDAHNLCYIYNSLPNGINPESVMGTTATAFQEINMTPYVATYAFTIRFNL